MAEQSVLLSSAQFRNIRANVGNLSTQEVVGIMILKLIQMCVIYFWDFML
jgi:hypothetical protein